jgi:hypothetical protein
MFGSGPVVWPSRLAFDVIQSSCCSERKYPPALAAHLPCWTCRFGTTALRLIRGSHPHVPFIVPPAPAPQLATFPFVPLPVCSPGPRLIIRADAPRSEEMAGGSAIGRSLQARATLNAVGGSRRIFTHSPRLHRLSYSGDTVDIILRRLIHSVSR